MFGKRRDINQASDGSFAGALKGRGAISMVLLLALGLVIAGLWLPALHVSSFGFLEDDVSIINGIEALFADGQSFLAWLILTVSVLFPLTKIVIALMITLGANPARAHRLAGLLAELARWSMADVFVLAVAVMVIDSRLISSADLRSGAYVFAIGVLVSGVTVTFLRVRLRGLAART